MVENAVAVVVRLTIARGREEDFKREMRAVLERVRQEPACLSVNGHQDAEDPSRFLLYELWRSHDEFREFETGCEYLREYLDRVVPWWSEPRDLSFWPLVA
jgi:quinol monooxygenase YgiN